MEIASAHDKELIAANAKYFSVPWRGIDRNSLLQKTMSRRTTLLRVTPRNLKKVRIILALHSSHCFIVGRTCGFQVTLVRWLWDKCNAWKVSLQSHFFSLLQMGVDSSFNRWWKSKEWPSIMCAIILVGDARREKAIFASSKATPNSACGKFRSIFSVWEIQL